MNSRSNLNRTQQWQLAERQRYLTELEALGEKLRADAERLDATIAEAGGADAAAVSRRLDPMFVRPLVERRDKLMGSIGEIDVQITEARAAVLSAEQEARLVDGGAIHRGLKFEDRLTRRMRRMI